ncbi:MAG TPA: hypothetical protein VF857_05770 [Spirochaetota bacterium]
MSIVLHYALHAIIISGTDKASPEKILIPHQHITLLASSGPPNRAPISLLK